MQNSLFDKSCYMCSIYARLAITCGVCAFTGNSKKVKSFAPSPRNLQRAVFLMHFPLRRSLYKSAKGLQKCLIVYFRVRRHRHGDGCRLLSRSLVPIARQRNVYTSVVFGHLSVGWISALTNKMQYSEPLSG